MRCHRNKEVIKALAEVLSHEEEMRWKRCEKCPLSYLKLTEDQLLYKCPVCGFTKLASGLKKPVVHTMVP